LPWVVPPAVKPRDQAASDLETAIAKVLLCHRC
jgi:hypothetical protein